MRGSFQGRSEIYTAIVIFALAVVCGKTARGDVEANVLERLKTEGFAAWRSLDARYQNFEVDIRFSSLEGKSTALKPVQTLLYRLAYDQDHRQTLLRGTVEGKPGITHRIANARYSFRVFASNPEKTGVLSEMTIAQSGADELPTWNSLRCDVMSANHLACMPAENLLGPDFKLLDLKQLQQNADAIIVLKCEYLGQQGPGRRENGVYTVHIDPSRHFRLMFWEIAVGDGRHEVCRIRYSSATDGIFPEHIEYRVDVDNWASEQQWTFGEFMPCRIPDDEFYLPHYGFSETVLETLNPNPWPRWTMVALGILLLAAGFWLLNRERRINS